MVMKKVLLTNAYCFGYSGSELDTLDVANYFLDNGYIVDIFALKVGKPLINEIDKRIRIITLANKDDFYDKYDVLWAHHYPIVDYLLFSTNIKFDYVHYVCLSSFEMLEQIPMYYEKFNLTSVMSYNTRMKLANENPLYKEEKINIFSNYAKKNFFSYKAKNYKNLKKIAIVSNHVPSELVEVSEMLRKDGIVVDIYGIGYTYVKVDSNVLSNYDLIISIGRTCFFSLAMGIPTYIYDRFGGVGYVTKDNILKCFQGNFVCMLDSKKVSKDKLYFDIINNYSFSLEDSKYFKKFGLKNFCFENNMDNTLKLLFSTEKFSNKIEDKEFLFLKKTSSLYVEKIFQYEYELLDNKLKCQIFYALGNEEFCDNKSIKKISNYLGNDKYEVEFFIKEKYDKIRFDFCEKSFVILSDLKLNNKDIDFTYSNIENVDGKLISLNNDPNIFIDVSKIKGKQIKITYSLKECLGSEFYSIIEEKRILEHRYNMLYNGRFYRGYRKLKGILKRVFK